MRKGRHFYKLEVGCVTNIRYLIPDTLDSDTWWGNQMHGGEPNPYMVGSQQAPGPAPRAPLARIQPGPLPKQACWLARPPCMWAGLHVWLPHYVFGFPTMYFDQGYQDFRYQVSEKRRKKLKN